MQTRRMLPIWGYGWTDHNIGATRDVPDPFEFVLDTQNPMLGTVSSQTHEFYKMSVKLSPRYVESSNNFNVEIWSANKLIVDGWAQLALEAQP